MLNNEYIHILITGDFKIHTLEVQAAPAEQFKADLQEPVSSFPLYGHISTPTRFREGDKPSILDRAFANEVLMIERITADAPLGRSDHLTLLSEYTCYAEYPVESTRATQTTVSYDKLARFSEAADWAFLKDEVPVSTWQHFVDMFKALVAEALETGAVRSGNRSSVVRSTTRKCIAVRNTVWQVYKTNPSAETWSAYVIQRNHCTQLNREDKVDYQQRLARRMVSNGKLLYKHVNALRKAMR